MIHILSLSNSHNNVASTQKNRRDKSHRVIVALLLTIWEEKFEGFDNKKRIKAEEWADLVKEYNMSASRHGFAIRSHNQIVNRVRNSVDTYKRYKDKHNSTGESSIPADDDTCPDYNILNRVLGGRQSINPQHILDPGKIPLSGPIHTSCCCRAKPIIIGCGTSTAFFMFDSNVERNLSNSITNQAKIAFVCGKMTEALNEELLETSY